MADHALAAIGRGRARGLGGRPGLQQLRHEGRPRGNARRRRRGSRRRRHALRHRRHLRRQGRQRVVPRRGARGPARPGRARDEVRQRHGRRDRGTAARARTSTRRSRRRCSGCAPTSIDLYQYHTPDNVTPFEETFGALDELVRAGKVRYVGHSNLDAAQVEEVDAICREHGFARPVSAQNQYSLLRREAEEELLPTCERLGIGVLPYFPLASGLLTGKYRRGEPRPEGTRLAGPGSGLHRRDVRTPGGTGGVRGGAWRHVAAGRDRRLARPAGDRFGDRRRDEAGAGARERRSGRMGSRPPEDLAELNSLR